MGDDPTTIPTSSVRQVIKALPLIFAGAWLIAFVAFTAMDYRQWPRQAATLFALTWSSAEAPAKIEGVSINRTRGKMTSYDVAYAFKTPDGTRHNQTQRVHAVAVPLDPWPRVVRYAVWSPGLNALMPGLLGAYVRAGLARPAIAAGIITVFALIASLLGLPGRKSS